MTISELSDAACAGEMQQELDISARLRSLSTDCMPHLLSEELLCRSLSAEGPDLHPEKKYPYKTNTHELAVADSVQTKPEADSEERQPEKQPVQNSVARKALDSMRQVTTYVASGLYNMIDNKLNAVLAMGTPGHLTWFFTYCLLRREVVRDQLEATAPLMHVLEGHWLFDWPHAFKKILAMGSDAMCAQARQSLPQEQAHLMQQNCRWIPAHLPQLHGPDAVFITTGVLGKVSKYTNPAWNSRFRTVDEMHEFMKMFTAPQPLAKLGLFPLIGVIPAASQNEGMNKNFWDIILRSNMTPISGTTIAADYTSCTELEVYCDDKLGNSLKCHITIHIPASSMRAQLTLG